MKVIDIPVINPETGNVVSLALTKEETQLLLTVAFGFMMTQGMIKIHELSGEAATIDLSKVEMGGNA